MTAISMGVNPKLAAFNKIAVRKAPSVKVNGIRTLSKSDNGKSFCAAQIDFTYENQDLNPVITDFFTQKISIFAIDFSSRM